ncbi:MAG: TonB-dependent receptor [Ottowia sp.]|nr:TonB-dependent receptor [Ottowia sp.]
MKPNTESRPRHTARATHGPHTPHTPHTAKRAPHPLHAIAAATRPPLRWARQPALAILAGMVSGLAWAAPDAPAEPGDTPALNEVTISASGLNRSSTDMAAPVSVMEGDDLVQRRGATLGETLEGEPGIRGSHFGAGASRPVIRGMDGPRVQVLSDGSEVQDASSVSPDHAVASEPLLARQIEVLRGPSALIHGGGAVGGVVNVLDNKIPTAAPAKGLEGSAELRANSGARGVLGAAQVTVGSGPLVLHAEGVGRNDRDYRVGSGWDDGRRVDGSFNRTHTGSLGLSWVGSRSYLGAAYTEQRARYGLPGHDHDIEDCHPHGSHLHCGGHDDHDHGDHDEEDGHDHAHEHGVPVVDLRSRRWDVRGELRQPFTGFEALRLRMGITDYQHDEREGDEVATTFLNKAWDARVELEHKPIGKLRGVFGLHTSNRRFSALGEEAYVEPTRTRRTSLFWLETLTWNDWRFEGALRHERQQARAVDSGVERKHNGTSASIGAVWRFQPGYQLSANFTHARRMPTAEELYARGLHMATRTYEVGNNQLSAERSSNLDVGLRKTQGDLTFGVNAYHNRIGGYIYGRTLDELDGVQLLAYTQQSARFTGLEGHIRQRLTRNLGVTLWGDAVHARLADGSRLPRIAPARVGVRLDASWQRWEGMVEWVQTRGARKVAEYETPTAGYGMLNLGVSYRKPMADGSNWLFYVRGTNLTDKLAYSHVSFIKAQAPLMGRSIAVGARYSF